MPLLSFSQVEMTNDKWQEDLIFLQQKLEERHANLYHTTSKDEFTHAINNLIKLGRSIDNKEIIVRISEVIATVGDAHTWLHPGYQDEWDFKQLPVKFEYFDDGLFIVTTDEEYSHLLGSKLISINSKPVSQIISKVSKIGYNENKFTRLISAEKFIVYPEILKRFGFIENIEEVQLELKINTMNKVFSMKPKLNRNIKWISYLERQEELPYVYKNRDSIYSTAYDPKDKLLYIQLNKCTENENYTFENLSNQIISKSKLHRPTKLVLDIRRNVGGNSMLVYPLIYALMEYEKEVPNGQLFVITGRWTLSASVVLCGEIQKYCKPIFVGEPTGAKANLYGENSYKITLPNSKLSISYSSEWFQPFGPFVDMEWVAPDIYISTRSDHYFNLEQPIVEEIKRYTSPKQKISDRIFDLAINDSINVAVKLYRDFKENPKNLYKDIRNDIRRMATKLGREKKLDYSRIFYELNHKYNPDDVLILVNFAQLQEDLKDYEKAKELYNQCLLLLNEDKQTNNYLKHYIEDYINSRLKELK